MNAIPNRVNDFLQAVYKELEFDRVGGTVLLTEAVLPVDPECLGTSLAQASWVEQARKLGAQAIFFIKAYPVVLFFELDVGFDANTETIEEQIRLLHLNVWNTSRVPLFFVALPTELRVYSAYQKPVRDLDDWRSQERWLKRVQQITHLAELQPFSRPEIESGRFFEQRGNAFERENRVDQWLLKNLRVLRQKLEGSNAEKREYAHALIGRSIFIRYLEDRKVLVPDYFADIGQDATYRCYTDLLQSKEDTYYLFRKLRQEFNGDLFPLSDEEEEALQEADLHLLRDFLLGRHLGDQPDLLFWAYKFDIIPIELISNIYEEFYHEQSDGKDKGTHYTPTALVDFILSQSLTTDRLNAGARVLDPACGSGIFLVEAFKRMVYHERQRQAGERLSRAQLSTLLTERIVGIDVNHSAIQVAAFSLYLAYLDFLAAPDIRQHKQLPKLVHDPAQSDSGKSLFHANAFYLTPAEQTELQTRLEQSKRYAGRADDERMSKQPLLPLHKFSFDVIIGNPPWGASHSSDNQLAAKWCQAFRYPVGDQELSQSFMWRTQRLLTPGGEIGLLVSTGVLFKHQTKSRQFRRQWLKENRIRAVYNFAHVRHFFFRKQKKDAMAPFAALFFTPTTKEDALQNRISYVSIKRSANVEQLQAVLINKTDLHQVRQSEFLAHDWLWKTYMWGGSQDVQLIGELKTFYGPLREVVSQSGRGYQEGGGPKKKATHELGVDVELRTKLFYQNRDFAELIKPISARMIHRLGETSLYQGPRLLVKRGISRSADKNGEIQARLASQPFAFRNSLIGFGLHNLSAEQQLVLLAIMRSSLAKYYHFLTCSTWGFWHDEIHLEEHLNLPIFITPGAELQNRILAALEQITTKSDRPTLFDANTPGWRAMQDELDDAIFDLYELSQTQRDLVRDLCQVTLQFFYDGTTSQAANPPTVAQLEAYRDAFLERWQARLAAKGKELEANIYAPHHGLLCGLSFELKDLGTALSHQPITDHSQWQRWFRRLSHSLLKEHSAHIYIDRIVKQLSEEAMFIIKRAERRLWTKSQARQDAHELLTEVFKLEWQRGRSRTK